MEDDLNNLTMTDDSEESVSRPKGCPGNDTLFILFRTMGINLSGRRLIPNY